MRAAIALAVAGAIALPRAVGAQSEPHSTSLHDVVVGLLGGSPVIGIYEAQRREAEGERLRVSGAFDTTIASSVSAQRSLLVSVNGAPSTRALDELFSQATVSARTRDNVGLEVGASAPLVASASPLENPDQPQAWVGVRVPLLKLGRSAGAAADERAAILHSQAIGSLLRDQRSALTMRVASEYWRWVASYAQLKLTRRLEALAQDQLKDVDALIQQNARPASDRLIVAAAADNATSDRVTAEQAMFDEQRALWTLIGRRPPTARAVPDEAMPDVPAKPLDRRAIAAKAREIAASRPFFAYLEQERSAAGVALEAARIATRPNLDFGVRGVVSRAQVADDLTAIVVGYAGMATLSFSLPVQNRAARGAFDVAVETHAERSQALVLEQETVTNTLDALAGDIVALAETYQRRVRATAEYEAAYDAERERFRSGTVTAMDVLVVEQQFMASSLRVVADRTAYAIALASLLHGTGLLDPPVTSSDASAVTRRLTTWPF